MNGFDDHLDNHGEPGIEPEELIDGLRHDSGDYAKQVQGIPMSHELSWDESNVRAWEAAEQIESLRQQLAEREEVDGMPIEYTPTVPQMRDMWTSGGQAPGSTHASTSRTQFEKGKSNESID